MWLSGCNYMVMVGVGIRLAVLCLFDYEILASFGVLLNVGCRGSYLESLGLVLEMLGGWLSPKIFDLRD